MDNHSEENTYCTSAGPQQEYWSQPKHGVPGTPAEHWTLVKLSYSVPHFVTRSPGWSSLISCLWNGSLWGGMVQDVGFHVAFQWEQRTKRSGGIFQKVLVGARKASRKQWSEGFNLRISTCSFSSIEQQFKCNSYSSIICNSSDDFRRIKVSETIKTAGHKKGPSAQEHVRTVLIYRIM